jgi:hypothetical protein
MPDPKEQDATVTTQPSITSDEAAETDSEEGSPTGDAKEKRGNADRPPESNDADVEPKDA